MFIKVKTFFQKFQNHRKKELAIEKSPEEILRGINERLGIEIDKMEEILFDAKEFNTQLNILIESQEQSIELLKESRFSVKKVLRHLKKNKVLVTDL